MKIALSLGIILAFSAVNFGCSRKPKDLKEQVSYSVGAQFGRSLKTQGLELDTKALGNGIVDGYKGEKLELTEEEMQQAMMKLAENRQAQQRATAEANKKKSDEFMEKNKTVDGVQTTESGLQYTITEPGTGPSPKDGEIVVVNFTGKTPEGLEFDSSAKRGQPAEFPVKGVVPGWSEGLMLMKKGGKATFYVPPNLGYGERSRQKMPPNSVLIFETELVDIKPAPPPRERGDRGRPGRPGGRPGRGGN